MTEYIKIKKTTLASWIEKFNWLILGIIIGASQGSWLAWLCYLPIFIILEFVCTDLRTGVKDASDRTQSESNI